MKTEDNEEKKLDNEWVCPHCSEVISLKQKYCNCQAFQVSGLCAFADGKIWD